MDIPKRCIATVALLLLQVADARSVLWENSGIDSEWNTSDNWTEGMMPGTERVDIAVFAGPKDVGEVTSTVHSRFPVDLTMRNEASLSIRADMESIRSIRMASTDSKGTTTIVHTAGRVTSSGFLSLGENGRAMYSISNSAALHLAEKVVVYDSGIFALSGSRASVSAGDLGFSLIGAGELQFTFDADGVGSITTTGSLSVDRVNARLTVDASACEGIGSFDLMTYGVLEGGGFAKRNVSITGLGSERTGAITYDEGRMILDIKAKRGAKGHYVDIPEPETYPLFVGIFALTYIILLSGRRR